MRRSKLLKVVSIIMIVFGVLGILSSVLLLLLLDTINSMMMDVGMPVYSASQLLVGVVGAIVSIVLGIIGIVYKSRLSVLIAGGIYLLFVVGEITFSVLSSGIFSMFVLLGLVFPLLYLWGGYLSE